jgi:hypothetical protein
VLGRVSGGGKKRRVSCDGAPLQFAESDRTELSENQIIGH